jgi:hypothetical protein
MQTMTRAVANASPLRASRLDLLNALSVLLNKFHTLSTQRLRFLPIRNQSVLRKSVLFEREQPFIIGQNIKRSLSMPSGSLLC